MVLLFFCSSTSSRCTAVTLYQILKTNFPFLFPYFLIEVEPIHYYEGMKFNCDIIPAPKELVSVGRDD